MNWTKIDAVIDIHWPNGVASLVIHEPTKDIGIDIKNLKIDFPGIGLNIHGHKKGDKISLKYSWT